MTARGNAIMQFHLAWEEAMRLNQLVTLRCAFCKWHVTDCLYFARREHRQHRADKHQITVRTRRKRHGRSPMMTASKGLDENIANARLQGASTWEGATT